MMLRRAALMLALGLFCPGPVAEVRAQQAARQPLLMEGRSTLFQREILRPGARLAERPDANAHSQPTPGFGVFYVYERQGSGADAWLEIGAAQDGRTQGWVRAERTIDWKQTMVLAFNNPAGRDRAMFFRDAETPRALWLNTRGGAAEATRLREAARANTEGQVIALEPENFIDITRQFYLLPIISAQRVENEAAQEARLLEVISAPAQATPPPTDPDALRNYRGAVVFVVDTTISMGPYIERTREALKRVVDRIRDSAVRDNFRFGMVAFRDYMGGNPRLEYVTRMVSLPDLAEASDAILPRLSQLAEARESNEGFDKDSLAGIKLALDEVPWQQYGGRFIVLVTDAGARDAKDPRGQTQMGPEEMRLLAQSEAKQVAIYAIHLKTPEGRDNYARAERQYRELTRFGAAGELYYPINEGNLNQFGQTVDALTDALLAQVAAAVGRPIAGIRAPQSAAERRISEQDAAAIHAAALRRQAAGRHDDALVLFEEAGERGHAPALTAVARLYDPIGFVAGRPFRAPDPRAAARYYRDAVQRGDAAAEAPRAALKTWLEEQARAGNGSAETTLREFWP
ncbi:MAG: VWA domain-containing protein [Roseomonas sp.]|nr:VWA domain-containing protein [Roseomonas sp.]